MWLTEKQKGLSQRTTCLLDWEVSYTDENPMIQARQVQTRNKVEQRKIEKCLVLIPKVKPPDLENGEF